MPFGFFVTCFCLRIFSPRKMHPIPKVSCVLHPPGTLSSGSSRTPRYSRLRQRTDPRSEIQEKPGDAITAEGPCDLVPKRQPGSGSFEDLTGAGGFTGRQLLLAAGRTPGLRATLTACLARLLQCPHCLGGGFPRARGLRQQGICQHPHCARRWGLWGPPGGLATMATWE